MRAWRFVQCHGELCDVSVRRVYDVCEWLGLRVGAGASGERLCYVSMGELCAAVFLCEV